MTCLWLNTIFCIHYRWCIHGIPQNIKQWRVHTWCIVIHMSRKHTAIWYSSAECNLKIACFDCDDWVSFFSFSSRRSGLPRPQNSPPIPPPKPARPAPGQQHIRAKLRSQLLSSHRRSAAASGPVVARHENSQRISPSSDSSSASEPSCPPTTPAPSTDHGPPLHRSHRVKAHSPQVSHGKH